jgi:Transposase and inactivated derivatives
MRRSALRLLRPTSWLHQVRHRAGGVGDCNDAPNARHVMGRTNHLAAKSQRLGRACIGVFHRNVIVPMRTGSRGVCGRIHHARNITTVDLKQRIRAEAAGIDFFPRSTEEGGKERPAGFLIRRNQLIPYERICIRHTLPPEPPLLEKVLLRPKRQKARPRYSYSGDYQRLLQDNSLVCSMNKKGDCYDNAAMESWSHSLKVEAIHGERYVTRQAAKDHVFEYIEVYYNRKRPHSRLGYLSPEAFELRHVA